MIVNAAEGNRNDMLKSLVDQGASERFLNTLTTSQLEKYYQLATNPNYTVTFQENSKELHFQENAITRGQIDRGILEIYSFTMCAWDNNNKLLFMKPYYEWKWAHGRPYIRNEDAITINWDASKFTCGNLHWLFSYYTTVELDGLKQINFDSHATWAESNQGGVGFYSDLTQLPTNPLTPIINDIGGRVAFELLPKEKNTIGKNSGSTQINVTYTHNTNPLPVSISFAIGPTGISVGEGAFLDQQSFVDSIIF